MSQMERRLTFTSINPLYASDMEAKYGKGVWLACPDDMWDGLPWSTPTVVMFVDDDRMDQYNTLKRWAETHEQPIRDVKLEERPLRPDDGWVEVTR